MSFLEIRNINKTFGNTEVLKNLNGEIEQGEFITLLGESGSGKSTLLRIVAGLEEMNSGEIFLEGKKINNVKAKDRNMGMIFQQYNLFPTMTVKENIEFGLKLKKLSKDEIDKLVNKFLSTVHLEGYEDSYPIQLSGGQQQRVALARSLIIKPKVMLFDEPLSAIDAKLRKELQIEIKRLHKEFGMTSIFVTHDQEEAMIISDRIFVMNNGNIEQIGTPKEIYENPKNLFVANFIGHYNVLDKKKVKEIFGIEIGKEHLLISPKNISLISKNEIDREINGKVKDIVYMGNRTYIYVEYKNLILKMELEKNSREIYLDDKISIFISLSEFNRVI